MADDLANLPPEERIRKLKQLEEKRKKEIEEAQQLIRKSEEELTERNKWKDKVPIPEFASEDFNGLSDEAKVILESKGLKEKKKDSSEEEDKKEEHSLEEALLSDQSINSARLEILTSTAAEVAGNLPHLEYVRELSQIPFEELQQRVEYLREVNEKEYNLNPQQQEEVINLYSAIDEKIKASEDGSYEGMTEETAKKALLSKRITGRLIDSLYQANKKSGGDLYKV